MKPFGLFLFRLATGAYLVAWAVVKFMNTERAIEISKTFYFGYFNEPAVQHGLGALAAVLGIFVALGFLRAFAYPAQALVLAIATAAVARTVIVVPVDLANGIEAATLLLPTLSVFFLSLTPLIWWKDDFLSLDRFIDFRRGELAGEAAAKTELAAPVAVAAVAQAAPVHEPAPVEAPAEAEETVSAEAGHGEEAPAEAAHDEAPAEAAHQHEDAQAHGEDHGHEAHGHEAHEPEAHGEAHEPEAHGHEAHGEAHEHEAHGHEDHAEEVHPAAHERHDAHGAPAAVH